MNWKSFCRMVAKEYDEEREREVHNSGGNMKIIIPGSLPELKIYRANCIHCYCVYEFMKNEATPEGTCRNESYLVTKCPTCSRQVWTHA